jgi:IclR family acetate operon transcriptional repressor
MQPGLSRSSRESAEVPALASAIRIVERLADAWPSGVRASELSSALGISRSSCYKLLGTLEQHGWVAPCGGRAGWALGPGLLRLTGLADQARARILQPEIEALARRLGFVVFGAERTPDGRFLVVAKADAPALVKVTVELGQSFPPTAPALMRVFVAWLDPRALDAQLARHPLQPFTPLTRTDRQALLEELARVRARGWTVSLQEYGMEQSGVAAPIFDAVGRPRAALCALGFASDLCARNADRVGELIRDAARRITARTAGRWAAG